MVNNLYYLTDDVLGLLELKEDYLFHKIPKEKVEYYIYESRKIGREMLDNFDSFRLDDLLMENGVSVLIMDKGSRNNIDVKSKFIFNKEERKIIIYRDSIETIYKCLSESKFKISRKQIYDINIAHELYHLLEHKYNKMTNELLEPVQKFSFWHFNKKSTVLKTRELAAYSFCKELLNLRFHPKLLDYIYLVSNNKMNSIELRNYVRELSSEYLKKVN